MTKPTKYYMTYEEARNRAKNGCLAAVGGFAISALTNFRISQEMNHEVKTQDALKVAAMFAVVAGIIWACMPNAANDPEEHMEHVKDAITEPLNVLIVRLVENQRELVNTASELEKKYSNNSWTYVGASSDSGKSASYMRGWNKGRTSIFDSDGVDDQVMPPDDDDDDITEEELQEFYRDLEDKYVV